MDIQPLLTWFKNAKRDLPWRQDPTPYHVWVSEVMLQQTQVKVVIPYFLAWMEKFPTIRALSESPFEDVIKAWEGLGYYSRCRNLYEGAKICVRDFKGELPYNVEDLKTIKGLGPYTIGALLSFAFKQRKAAVDGNVLRVMSRFTLNYTDITDAKTRKKIEDEVEKLLPKKKPWVAMEALIELGALVCTKAPKCLECPLREQCLAFRHQETASLPVKKKGPAITYLIRHPVILKADGHVLLKKGDPGKIMADLYEFPYFETPKKLPKKELSKLITTWGLKNFIMEELEPVEHGFTRYQATLYPVWIEITEKIEINPYVWMKESALSILPFSSGHRRLYQAHFS